MRGLTLDGVGDISYRTDIDDPRLEDHTDAIVKVTAAVVTMNLLGELGISQDRMLRALHENRDLRWTCELAREHFGEAPEVEAAR